MRKFYVISYAELLFIVFLNLYVNIFKKSFEILKK